MKRVLILTERLDETNDVLETMAELMPKENAVIIVIGNDQLDLYFDDNRMTNPNLSLNNARAYINTADNIILADDHVLYNYLTQYLLRDVDHKKLITRHNLYYWASTPDGSPGDHYDFNFIHHELVHDLMHRTTENFYESVALHIELMKLISALYGEFKNHIFNSIKDASDDHPNAGFYDGDNISVEYLSANPSDPEDANDVWFSYNIADPVSFKPKRNRDEIPTLELNINVFFTHDAMHLMDLNKTLEDIVDHDYVKLCVALHECYGTLDSNIITVEIPLDENMKSIGTGIKPEILVSDWQSVLKKDGFDDAVIRYASDLINTFITGTFDI